MDQMAVSPPVAAGRACRDAARRGNEAWLAPLRGEKRYETSTRNRAPARDQCNEVGAHTGPGLRCRAECGRVRPGPCPSGSAPEEDRASATATVWRPEAVGSATLRYGNSGRRRKTSKETELTKLSASDCHRTMSAGRLARTGCGQFGITYLKDPEASFTLPRAPRFAIAEVSLSV